MVDALYLNSSRTDVSYYFMHIPKTGGYTMNKLMLKLKKERGDFGEYCEFEGTFKGSYSERQAHRVWKSQPAAPARILTFFRNPLDLLLSQYRHCKYAFYKPEGPYNTNLPPFGQWIQYFKEKGEAAFHPRYCFHCGNFKCKYNVYNQYMRTMEGHGLEELWFFGLTELFEPSYCLLVYQLTGEIPPSCVCGTQNRMVIPLDNHRLSKASMSSQFNILPGDLEIAQNITSLDQEFYVNAKKEFVRRIRTVEEKMKTKILCEGDLVVLDKIGTDYKNWV